MTAEPDPRVPASYPRRIVVASLGLAPQVLTETLYCLGTAEPSFVPTEIHVVTTQEGRHRAILTLLDDSSAMLGALEADYGFLAACRTDVFCRAAAEGFRRSTLTLEA